MQQLFYVFKTTVYA